MNSDGSLSPNSKNAGCFFGVAKELDKVLEKDIADNLRDVVKTFAEKCPQATITLYVEKTPAIQEIQTILGKEDATEKEKIDWLSSMTEVEVTWYKYAWLDFGAANFGVAKGKVVVLRAHTEKMK